VFGRVIALSSHCHHYRSHSQTLPPTVERVTAYTKYGHLLAEVASSLGVPSSVRCMYGQINRLIELPLTVDYIHNAIYYPVVFSLYITAV